MRLSPPKKIIVEQKVVDSPLVEQVKRNLPQVPVEVVSHWKDFPGNDPDVLEIVSFRGRLLKSCPGTKHYLCCGYQILHFGTQCTLDCTYCILQAYLNQASLRLFGNEEEIFQALLQELGQNPDTLYRIGTGEFTDSLLLDPWTGFSRRIVPLFARQSNAVLELKTKTDFVENLQGLNHGGRTLIGWSLNTRSVQLMEEPRTASIKQRLAAAQRVSQWGYFLTFHFDPMVEQKDWRQGYRETLEEVFQAVDPSRIVWISLGAFRFMPQLKPIVQRRHPRTRILYGEFITGLDQKMRYFRDIRVELYSFMWEIIRKADPRLCVYLCMESEDIWKEAMGFSPAQKGGLARMLDDAVQRKMSIGLHCSRSAPCQHEPS